jgi:hypothetical protein
MTDKSERMLKLLQAMKACPCCGYELQNFEQFAHGVFEFTAEAAFTCGARVQLHPDSSHSMLQAADGCPGALVSQLDDIEMESDETNLYGDEEAA